MEQENLQEDERMTLTFSKPTNAASFTPLNFTEAPHCVSKESETKEHACPILIGPFPIFNTSIPKRMHLTSFEAPG